MSMDRIHEEKFDVEDRLQKVKEELEDIKRQNEDYQKNLALMAKVCDNDSAIEVMFRLNSGNFGIFDHTQSIMNLESSVSKA